MTELRRRGRPRGKLDRVALECVGARDEIAFVRAVLQSVDPAVAATRYLPSSRGELPQRALQRLASRLIAVGERQGLHEPARQLRAALRARPFRAGNAGHLDPTVAPPSSATASGVHGIPDDWDGFLTEAEAVASLSSGAQPSASAHVSPSVPETASAVVHARRTGPPPSPGASARDRKRRAALGALEALAATSRGRPSADDPLGCWLTPLAAGRLEDAGVTAVRALVERIRAQGSRWHVALPGIGRRRAAAVDAWLRRSDLSTPAPSGQAESSPALPVAFERFVGTRRSEATRRAAGTVIRRFSAWAAAQVDVTGGGMWLTPAIVSAYRRDCEWLPAERIRPRGPAAADVHARPWRTVPSNANLQREAALLASLFASLSATEWPAASMSAAEARAWRRQLRQASMDSRTVSRAVSAD